DLGVDPAAGAAGVMMTGGHRASVLAVAAGRADLAAIDCRAWALAQRHEPCARSLVVLGWTAARPGLPYVTGPRTAPALAERLTRTLIGMGCHPPLREVA
ncbi:MAG TPA: PhnD/SsuA/transferrin family substrate-binding protein, partial [Paracoccus sp.]|nr:PhnD/SsuA/transferrin family substrate-binding protein [Paracoccus sp. (in: a-proteobacteria)]